MFRRNVLSYLYETVEKGGDRPAFSDERETYSFRAMKDAAESVGSFLLHRGIDRRPVAVFMKKSVREIAAFFGVIAAGSFYVPLDEEMPAGRIQLILDNVQAPLVICDGDTLEKAREFDLHGGEAVLFDLCAAEVPDLPALQNARDRALDTDPIYIVFTSGSTGIPKGVAACHRSVIDYVEQLSEVLGFNENTVFGNQSPLYFDACLKELYPTLKFGAHTHLIPRRLFSTPAALVEYLNERRVNTVCWVVSALTMISAFDTFSVVKPEYLKTVAFGSEVFPVKQFLYWRRALPDAVFTNLYGPTEGTGMCCYYRVEREPTAEDPIPIGRPFPNREILLLDEEGKRVKDGETGEIYLRGNAVTLGYYNDPERTAAAFVQNPLQSAYPEILYRTGDLAYRNGRGELVYVSRRDHQIKHMGHRVELGEIEVNVDLLPQVKLSAAIYDAEKKKIVLYYLGDCAEKDLEALLKTRLPRYMMPGRIFRLEEMPFTANGKIDRLALKRRWEQK